MPRSSTRPRSAPAVSLVKHLIAIVVVLIVAGCSGGGGCGGGCSSCGGITPLQNGFDVQHRIENAGSVRLTQSGLGFLQSNLGTLAKGLLGGSSMNGVLDFSIPPSSGNTTGVTYDVCPNGPKPNANPPECTAEINLAQANLTITPAGPNDLHITGTLPLRLQDLPLHIKALCIGSFCAIDSDVTAALNGDGSCPGGTYDSFPLSVDIAIHVDQNVNHVARFGYSQVKINQIFDQNAANSNLSNSVSICGGFLGSVLNAVKGLIIGQLASSLTGTLTSQIDDQLCQKATATAPCPTGTTADGSMICRYGDNSCASIILGTDGHMDLGGLLASISPGTKGGLDFLFAAGGADKNDTDPAMKLAWGDLDPVNNGATLGMFGGAEPTPLSKCVKISNLALPTGIPIPTEIFGNAAPAGANWPASVPGPHVGIALSERFTNYAMNGVYNSGLLCIGISTESIPLLSSGTLGLLAPSAKDLGLQHEPQQVAIVIRPAAPPTITFGNGTDLATDPLLDVKLPQASLDFYFYSLDRFVRFMTATFDLDVPVNLSVGPDGLTPVIDKIGVNNGKVTNSQLLSEMPDGLAASLGDLIGSLVGQQLGGALKPIDLNKSLASLGLKLIIPDSVDGQGSPGLRKLTKGTDNYLGIFAAFALPTGPVPPPPPGMNATASHTNVEMTRKTVDKAGLKLATLSRDNVPSIELHAVSALDDGTRAVEFAYKVDDGFWHPWTRSRFLTVRDDWFRVQGRHTVQVRSRAVGDSDSVDATPASIEVVIDAEPPALRLAEGADGNVTITATDRITPDALVRYRLDNNAWSSWTLASRLAAVDVGEALDITVEAKDNEGNLGTATQPLIRGRADGVAAAGCGCTAVGTTATPQGVWLLGIAIAGVAARLFRRAKREARAAVKAPVSSTARTVARRTLGGFAAVAFAASWAGCNCGDGQTTSNSTGHTTSSSGSSSGGYSCSGSCVPLQPGLIGEYTSAAVSGADIWFAGYSEADWDNSVTYGDLVAGKWDGTKVAWNQVDGVPDKPPPDGTVYDLDGFRGGQGEPGDDVGLWTSIAIGGDKNPAIAYYDRTNKALKFAQFDGKNWKAHQVETKDHGDVGRYAKMLFLNGNFVIAYQSIEPGGTNGALISKVRIATSAGATPAAGGWAFEDAAVSMTTPCRAAFCTTGTACVAASKLCTPTLDASKCMPSCASGAACVDTGTPTCATTFDLTKLDAYPDAIGGYIALAPDGQGGFGIAYYDRTNGVLDIASKAGGTWTTLVVDGQDAMGNNIADVGIGTSLFIDANGDWNLTYVNGFTEAVQYVKVTKGTMVGTPEVVDDGLGVGGTPFDDGQHLVGDDSHVVVLSSGEVHVTYQDATAGTLHHAVGTAAAGGHTWVVSAPKQDGFAGAFSTIVTTNNQLQLASWWRVGGVGGVKGVVGGVAPSRPVGPCGGGGAAPPRLPPPVSLPSSSLPPPALRSRARSARSDRPPRRSGSASWRTRRAAGPRSSPRARWRGCGRGRRAT
jgi:hypothetical protein